MNEILIENVCRKVLKEYMGVSDEVSELAEEAYNMMVFSAEKGSIWSNYKVADGIDYVKFLKFEKPYLSEFKVGGLIDAFDVTLFGYDPRETTFDECYNSLDKLGYVRLGFTPTLNRIVIRIPYPLKGKLDSDTEMFLKSSFEHEFKHAFQYNKRNDRNPISDMYRNSLNSTNWESDESPGVKIMRSAVKRCYYIFDFDEVDARLQEIWYDLKNGYELEESKAYNDVNEAIKDYKFVRGVLFPKSDFDVNYYKDERAMFPEVLTSELGNITPNQWVKYCDRGIRKFKEQLRRIMGRKLEMFGNENSGSFKEYAQNEIPQGELFRLKKTNPSLWRKIVNKIRNNMR